MKMVKKLPLLLLMAAPYFVPVQSRAGVIGDLLKALLGNSNKSQKDPPKQTPGTTNSVPLDGGVVFLMLAGVGLGAKLIYDAKAQKKVVSGI
jgi:hypothetical protein